MLENVPSPPDGVSFVHRGGRIHGNAEVVTAHGEPILTSAEGDLLEGRRCVVLNGLEGLGSIHPAHIDGADADAAVDLVVSPGHVVNGHHPDQHETHEQGDERVPAPAGVAHLLALTRQRLCCLDSRLLGGPGVTRLAYLFQIVAPPTIPISATDQPGRAATGADYRGNYSKVQPLWRKCLGNICALDRNTTT